ncbi:OLC1v1033796C2 [Oldenlandia corymbosa var. corymbosa]|nr:OLC1v1033796C2 [Oldenlandia corymbosa var. corymbosa]
MRSINNFEHLRDVLIDFGSLCMGDPNPDDAGVPPPSANFSEQFQWPPPPSPESPTTQKLLDSSKGEGWPAKSLNPSDDNDNIWALPPNFYDNVGIGIPQDTVFGVPGNPSSTYFRSIQSIYGNPNPCYDYYYPSKLQNSGSLPGYNATSFIANQGLEIPATYYAQRMMNYSLPPGFNFLETALSPTRSVQLKRALEQGRYVKETLAQVIPSILLLIADRNGSRMFDTLLERCESCDLYAIIMQFSVEGNDPFKAALSCETGSRALQRLIRKLKNTGLESGLALVLSRIAEDLMKHKIASHVIRHCFCVWGAEQNKFLYDCVLDCFLSLAMDPIGCISVNDCIEHITGLRRSHLLKLVVKNASRLSRDPSGNFVVQYVLSIQDELLNESICLSLSGQFVELAQKKGGSHLVEKCLLYSDFGRSLVLKEISRSEKTLSMLAKHQFGNYVIQKALKVAMLYDQNMYQRLIKVIKHSCPKLVEKFEGKSYLQQQQ